MTQAPISILSFNRPALLRRVLESLRPQVSDASMVALFQDGGTDEAETCRTTFQEIFPEGKQFVSNTNLGVALNFDRAERHAFETLKADYGIFLEDDLVLGPHYLEALQQLVDFALNEPRVAYVAAYGNHRATLEEQRERSSEVIPMDHKWGFALTRRQWERQREIIAPYLEIVRQAPYAKRDSQAIYAYFDKLGYSSPGTSQDGAKDVASHVLGTTKIMSLACFAKYEGREGHHSTAKFYDEQGYGQTILYPDPPKLVMPSSKQIDAWIGGGRIVSRHLVSTWPSTALREKIFGHNPYEGFEPIISEPDLQGWNGNHPALRRIVQEAKPAVIVDVGVWKGQSTITLAKAQRLTANRGTVIAVDTFLGSPEHWSPDRADVQASLRFKYGRPAIYETFLSNVVLSNLAPYVIPLPQTSENAAAILAKNKVSPDLVHIDAAHEYDAVLRDMEVWWKLLRRGGIMIGDDFVWPGVARAVVHFSDKMAVSFQVEHPKWWLVKP